MQTTLQPLISLPQQPLLDALKTSLQGLSSADAAERLQTYGFNQFTTAHKRSAMVESLLRAFNPLVGILILAALISSLTGSHVNAIIIILVVGFSVILDYFQSHRSLLAVERLRAQVAAMATVCRDNQWNDIPAKVLVPGDIIRLTAGDLVPADSLLLSAKDLHVQQAALTGESLPIEKEATPNQKPSLTPIEAQNAVFSGSSIVSGTATAVVVSTGTHTEFGQIAKDLNLRPPHTEFENGILRFGLFITKTIMVLIIFVFSVSIYLKRDLIESLLFSIALAVGLTPEFLPMITTVTLAVGAVRMSRQKVIVKNLASIQNLGSIDILCSDKTGTLTTGEMVLEKYINIEEKSDENVLLLAYLNSFFQTGVKNPIDTAILQKTRMNPLDIAILKHDHPDIQPYLKIDEIPFDFERRRASVVVDKNGEHLLITKGAPEHVLQICTQFEKNGQIVPMEQTIRAHALDLFKSISRQGYRLLAVAYKKMAKQPAYHANDETDVTFAGFLVFTDPPLPKALEVIQALKREGVKVKILTGDNELVAQHLCQQVGLNPDRILLGSELEKLNTQALGKIAEETLLFARVSPSQKQQIIESLRNRNHVVGFMGDGINDAPSLHSADVGISVAGAVDVAKEAANIILLEQNLSVLLSGILEGRKAFGNVMKYLMMGTSSNFGNVFSMAGAIIFLPFLPMLPVQILLNNLLYDFAQVTIPSDHVDPSLTRKPRHWDIEIIRRFMIYVGPISSLFDFITFYVLLKLFASSEAMFQTGWFIESLATQTLVIFIIRTAGNPFKNRPSLPLTLSVCTMVIIGLLLPISPFAEYLGFVPLPPLYFGFLLIATTAYLLLVQLIKQKLMWRWLNAKR